MDIQVLLSTYNGQKFIGDQIESILSQSYTNVNLLIRDDGSQDDTVKVIEKFLKIYPGRIELIKGSNIGVVRSFQELLMKADINCFYYSFCDQDDIWLSHKLETAIKKIQKVDQEKPTLLCTSTYLTNSELQKIKVWPKSPCKPLSFYNALIENIAVGTTITINKKAKEIILSKQPTTNHVIMHDWWFYLCVSALGEVIYDETPSVLYRQHENNLVGGNKTIIDVFFRKLKSFSTNRGKHILQNQAREFLKCYGSELQENKKLQLDLFVSPRRNFISRILYLRRSKLYRQSYQENLLFKFLILIGYI